MSLTNRLLTPRHRGRANYVGCESSSCDLPISMNLDEEKMNAVRMGGKALRLQRLATSKHCGSGQNSVQGSIVGEASES